MKEDSLKKNQSESKIPFKYGFRIVCFVAPLAVLNLYLLFMAYGNITLFFVANSLVGSVLLFVLSTEGEYIDRKFASLIMRLYAKMIRAGLIEVDYD